MAVLGAFKQQLASLIQLHPTHRPWHYPLLCALCVGMPAFAGAASGHFTESLSACLGALAIVYLPLTGQRQRARHILLGGSAGLLLCHLVGMLGGTIPVLFPCVLGGVAGVSTYLCGYFALQPPGNFFFVMTVAIVGCRQMPIEQMPVELAMVATGSLFTCMLGFLYRQWVSVPEAPSPLVGHFEQGVELKVAVITGVFVSASLWVASVLGMDNPYWVPTSCAAIMQVASPQAIWTRKLQRIAGTVIGIVPTSWIFALSPTAWTLALMIGALSFCIEWLIARNYGLAVIFITPLTIIFAEGQSPQASVAPFEIARLCDVLLGSAIGFSGSVVLFNIHQKQSVKGA